MQKVEQAAKDKIILLAKSYDVEAEFINNKLSVRGDNEKVKEFQTFLNSFNKN